MEEYMHWENIAPELKGVLQNQEKILQLESVHLPVEEQMPHMLLV